MQNKIVSSLYTVKDEKKVKKASVKGKLKRAHTLQERKLVMETILLQHRTTVFNKENSAIKCEK